MRSSTSPSCDRRALGRGFVLGLAAAACGLVGAPGTALAQSYPLGGISVDVGPLRAKGLAGFADYIGGAVHAQLSAQFADRLTRDRRAPVLVASLTSISMASYAGNGRGRRGTGGDGQDSDFLQGVLTVNGQVIPLLVQQYASGGGAWYGPQSERNRVDNLAKAFAYWARRKLGA